MSLEENTTVETDTTVEAPVEEVIAEESLNLDDLMNADLSEDSAMVGTHKGLPSYGEILKHLPENGRKLIQNLRQSYTEKTQSLADMRREIESERAELGRQRQLLTQSDFTNKISEAASKIHEHEAWSDEGLEERINTKAAQLMQQMLQPLQEDLASQSRQASLNAFKVAHPDLVSDEMRVPVAKMLMERPELKLEDAYHIVRSQLGKIAADTKRAETVSTLKKVGTGTAVRGGEAPKFKSAWDAYNFHKSQGMK